MRYILKGDNDYLNPIKTILKNRNITEELFSLTEEVVEDYNNYDDIQKGIEVLMYNIKNNNKIGILQDVDVDGLTSSTEIYRYIRDVIGYKNIQYIIHTEKIHGLSKDITIEEDIKLIIIPDASSNDYDQHKYYKNKGVDIIVLDHHPAEYISENAIIINNRLSKNVKNKELSGAGVTYKFLKALDDYLFEDKADNYLDLLALGNIADMMNLKEKETRYLCYRGIKEINNPFIKALIEKNSFSLKGKYNINKIGWVIAPKLNGTIRSGTQEVKENMFKAFISDDYDFCLKIAEECKKAKDSQDNAVKRILPKIEENVKLDENDRVIILEIPKTLKQAHIGLVANKLQDKYGVPVFLHKKEKDELLNGNARGNSNITDNFKRDLSESNLCEYAEGQPQAFGLSIKKDNLDKLKQYLNQLYKDKKIISGKTYEVDLIVDRKNLDYWIIEEISQYEDEWGNGLPEPLILFENIPINITEDNLKGKKNPKTMVFEYNNIKFVKEFLSNIIKDSVLDRGDLSVNIIGKCILNYYNGNTYPQVEVVDLEINNIKGD